MLTPKPLPVKSLGNLRGRMDRLFRQPTESSNRRCQLTLDLLLPLSPGREVDDSRNRITAFLNHIINVSSSGNVYLFGGILRDIALFGRHGFNSDIDVVVEGNWQNCVAYLKTLGAGKNKFGGYRLEVGEWPIDIWSANETWAIAQGLVEYNGISSLTETTVLNWDAILMNWKTREFVCRENYLEEINTRTLGVILEKNPDPLGMAVRVFRHLCLKDAKNITPSAAEYLAKCAKEYHFDDIRSREIRGYGNSVIESAVYKVFAHLTSQEDLGHHYSSSIACDIVNPRLALS